MFLCKNFYLSMFKWKRIFRSLRDIEDVPLRRKLIFLQKPWTLHRPFYLYFCFIRATIRSCLCFILALLIGLYHKYAYWGNGARRWLYEMHNKVRVSLIEWCMAPNHCKCQGLTCMNSQSWHHIFLYGYSS